MYGSRNPFSPTSSYPSSTWRTETLSVKPFILINFHNVAVRSIRAMATSKMIYGGFNNKWSLQGMTALVTGGTRGNGHAIVTELATLGASVFTCARNAVELDQCLENWQNGGFLVTGSVCDVSIRQQREELMDTVSSGFNGKLNILVNNVGTNIRKPVVEFTADEYSTLMATNFESAFHLSQLSYPLLKSSGYGSVVFISSVSGFVSLKYMSLLGANKGAINQLTRNLACEWAEDNIRCNAVAPWYIKTSMVDKILRNKKYMEEVLSHTPMGRLGEPAETTDGRSLEQQLSPLEEPRKSGMPILDELAELGSDRHGSVIHMCAHHEAELNQCLKDWARKSFQVSGSVCDVSCGAQKDKLMQEVSVQFDGQLNVLVNNVCTCEAKPMIEYTAEHLFSNGHKL